MSEFLSLLVPPVRCQFRYQLTNPALLPWVNFPTVN